ncbi:MAG: DUF819 family protein [Bacteroidetes bacterium]|nr:DUF819 family protein [Bacteroidota bacterium]
MPTDTLYILAVLCLIVVASEWMVRRTWMRHMGTALVVILVTAVAANLGILPAGSTEQAPVPVYDYTFAYLAPIAIFWLLLRCNLRDILKAGLPLVALFVIGAMGTTIGVLVGMWAVGGPENIGPLYNAIGGMFTGTYTGGSINFNAVALHYDVVREGALYAGAIVVDNIATTVWMMITLALPRLLAPLWKRSSSETEATVSNEASLGVKEDTETVHPQDIALVLSLGLGALWISNLLAEWMESFGFAVPSIILVTVLALAIAQTPLAARLRGAQALGMFAVYIFLCVVGAFCDVTALRGLGSLGVSLMIFASITVLVHGLIIFGAARVMKLDPDMAAVASTANVGGGTTALVVARSLGRQDLVLPAVLIGSLGTALGTFLGFWAAGQLLPWLLG